MNLLILALQARYFKDIQKMIAPLEDFGSYLLQLGIFSCKSSARVCPMLDLNIQQAFESIQVLLPVMWCTSFVSNVFVVARHDSFNWITAFSSDHFICISSSTSQEYRMTLLFFSSLSFPFSSFSFFFLKENERIHCKK